MFAYVCGVSTCDAPLKRLEKATQEFSDGKLDARVTPLLPKRHDELTDIAATFDKMADRTSSLIQNQRQLLADLSHELRTPWRVLIWR